MHGGVVTPGVSRKTQTIPISGFNHAALTLAPYASRTPYGCAVQCSLPSGCQPFSGGSVYPLGIDYMFHLPFVGFLMFWLLARDPIGSTSVTVTDAASGPVTAPAMTSIRIVDHAFIRLSCGSSPKNRRRNAGGGCSQHRRIEHDVFDAYSLPRVRDVYSSIGRLNHGGIGEVALIAPRRH